MFSIMESGGKDEHDDQRPDFSNRNAPIEMAKRCSSWQTLFAH